MQDYDDKDMNFFKKVILHEWDVNHDGKINKQELKMILLQQSKLASSTDNTMIWAIWLRVAYLTA